MTKLTRQNLPKLVTRWWQTHIHPETIAVLAVVMLAAAVNIWWVNVETRPPHWDMGRHLFNGVVYFAQFKNHSWFPLLGGYYGYYPPFLYYTAIPFLLIFHPSVTSAVSTNIVFVAILVFSIYGIGARLWSRRVGLLASILVLATPMLAMQFKEFQIDAPLTAWVALTIYVLLRTQAFRSRRWSIVLGIVLGLGMLLKWTFIFIVGLPLAYAAIQAGIYAFKHKDWQVLTNLVLASLLGYLIMSPWYWLNLKNIYHDVVFNATTAGLDDPPVGSLASNIWYINVLVNVQLYLVPTILFVVGSVVMVLKRAAIRQNLYPILLVVGCFGFFVLTRNKDARYTLPLLTGVGIIACYWVDYLKVSARWLVAAGIVAYSAFIFVSVSVGLGGLPREVVVPTQPVAITVYAQHGYIIGPPTHEDWKQRALFTELARQYPAATIYMKHSPDEKWFNKWGSRYYALLGGLSQTDDITTAKLVVAAQPLDDPNFQLLKKEDLFDGTVVYVYAR